MSIILIKVLFRCSLIFLFFLDWSIILEKFEHYITFANINLEDIEKSIENELDLNNTEDDISKLIEYFKENETKKRLIINMKNKLFV